MTLKPNDRLIWYGKDGILKRGQLYLVWQVRDTETGQEFTLKYPDWQMVFPIVWHKEGERFIKPREAAA